MTASSPHRELSGAAYNDRMNAAMVEARGRFRRRFESLDAMFELTSGFLRANDIKDSDAYSVTFALEEIFTNYVKYNASGESDIEVYLRMQDDAVRMTLTDFDSPRFDPTTDAPKVDTSLPLSERQPGGLGLHLVIQMVDRVEYAHHDRMSSIIITKRVTRPGRV